MSDAPSCSVVVPTYERPDALRGCLESLTALDYPRERYEVVVVDDGGRAPLEEVVAPARERMRVELVSQPRGGPAAARNAGVARAGGGGTHSRARRSS